MSARAASRRPDARGQSEDEHASSRFLTVGKKRIHYTVEGRGPALVLLHGAFASVQSWQGWVDALAQHYRIVRIDLPGFGLSDRAASDDYSPEHAIEVIERFRCTLGLERFHLVGSSLGGFVSWYYAAMHAERIDKLILIDPLGYPHKLPAITTFMSLPLIGALSCRMSPRFIAQQHVRATYGDPQAVGSDVLARYERMLARGGSRVATVETLRQLRAMHEDDALSTHIKRVTAETLLMWGERDRWAPCSLIEAWRRDLPRAEVIVYPNAGHMPMEELPELTARDAHAFLSRGAARNDELGPTLPSEAVPFVFARA